MKSKVKKSILLVEDDTILAMSEEMDLKDYGYSVMTECSGEDAVNFVKLNPDIDLILMDIDLGSGIDGTEAAEIILKDRDIPVIFVSSHTEPEIVERTEKITSYGYVVKGSGITALDASIKMAFKLFEAKISEKRKGESLSRSEERFTLAMNASNDGLFDWNLITGEVYYSPGWKKILGYEDNELKNKVTTWESLIEPGDLVKALEIHEKLISKEIDRFDLEYKNEA